MEGKSYEKTIISIALVHDLGLEIGIIDLIQCPNGEIVFLECNSQGHWIWIEELTGLPITEKLCNLLTQ